MEYQQYLDQYVSYDPILARRCWAAIIDYVLYFIFLILYTHLVGNVKAWNLDSGSFHVSLTPGPIPMIILWLLYFPMMESLFGYTLGKGIFDLRVIRERKDDFPFAVALKRHLTDPIDFAFFGVVGILMVRLTKNHKRLGDMLAHSLVIREK